MSQVLCSRSLCLRSCGQHLMIRGTAREPFLIQRLTVLTSRQRVLSAGCVASEGPLPGVEEEVGLHEGIYSSEPPHPRPQALGQARACLSPVGEALGGPRLGLWAGHGLRR